MFGECLDSRCEGIIARQAGLFAPALEPDAGGIAVRDRRKIGDLVQKHRCPHFSTVRTRVRTGKARVNTDRPGCREDVPVPPLWRRAAGRPMLSEMIPSQEYPAC